MYYDFFARFYKVNSRFRNVQSVVVGRIFPVVFPVGVLDVRYWRAERYVRTVIIVRRCLRTIRGHRPQRVSSSPKYFTDMIFMPRLGGAYCFRRVRSQRKSVDWGTMGRAIGGAFECYAHISSFPSVLV